MSKQAYLVVPVLHKLRVTSHLVFHLEKWRQISHPILQISAYLRHAKTFENLRVSSYNPRILFLRHVHI